MSLEGAAGAEPRDQPRPVVQPLEYYRWCQMTASNVHHQGEGSLMTDLTTGP